MKTDDFIDLLSDRRLVPEAILRQLRAKAAQGDHRITSDSILKFLVQKELVTRAQAKELMETSLVVSDKAESSILGTASLPDPPMAPLEPPRRSPPREDFGLTPLDEDDDDAPVQLTPIARPPAAEPPLERPPAPTKLPKAGPPAPPARKKSDDDLLFAPAGQAPPVGSLGAAEAASGERGHSGTPRIRSRKSSKGKNKGKGKGKRSRKRGKDQWDSPLLLLGGGALVSLLLAGVVLWYLLFRESADKVLTEANDSFAKGSYAQAIEKYENFVEKFSTHKDFSRAKVRLHLARVWQAVDSPGDPAIGLQMVQEAIGQIEDEPAFISDGEENKDGLSEAKRQLSALLTRIAKGVADRADAAKDDAEVKERIKQLETTLALCANNKYVPEQFRNAAELTAARDTLDRVQKRQSRDADLAAALAKMDEAIAKGDTASAFAVRLDLLSHHPVLQGDESLAAKVHDASAAAQGLVKYVAEKKAAVTQAPRTAVIAELSLAERRGDPAPDAGADGPVVVCIDGALYGLQAVDGALVWRRYLGIDDASRPVLLPNGSVVVADPHAGGLVALDAASGKLRWLLPLADKLTTPVPLGDRLLIGGESGKLFIVNAATGEMTGHVDLPQPIRVPPAVNDRGDRIYVVADQSILVALSAADMSCVGVYYLGHSPSSVVTPPIAVLNKVILAENSGAEFCRLHVLSLDDKGAPAKEVTSSRLNGLVVTPLVEAGRRFAAITTRGQATVYELSGAGDEKSLSALASRDAQGQDQVARYGLLHEGHLWMAGDQLLKLAILPTGNQLSVRSLERDYQGDAFDYPPQLAGKLLIHVRRPAGRAGAIVAATNMSDDRPAWETELAVPLAGAPAVDAARMRVSAATATGALFLIDRQAMGRGVQDYALRAGAESDEKTPYTASLDLGDGRMAIAAPGGSRLLHFRPEDPREPVTAIELGSPLSSPPVRWGKGFAAATDVGQTLLFDADSGEKLATAFQPELKPNQKTHWLRPVAVDDGAEAQLLVSDGVEKLYSVALKSQPEPHLEAVATVDVGPSPLTTPLAVLAPRVFAGTADGGLAIFGLPALNPIEPLKLSARIQWGPFATPSGLLMGVDSGVLALVAADGVVVWHRKLEHGPLAGEPLVSEKEIVVLHSAGGLAVVNLSDGSETSYTDLGQPGVAGPTPLGERLLVVAPDGTLLVVNR